MPIFFKFTVILVFGIAINACGGGGGYNGPEMQNTDQTPSLALVTISGSITYERIPFADNSFGLDYPRKTNLPARGILVEALNEADQVVASTSTDLSGQYAFDVPANTEIRIAVTSMLTQPDFRVTDNTQANAVYQLMGGLISSGDHDSVRNLNAPSGWDTAQYVNERPAAPLAILDTVYGGILRLEEELGAEIDVAEMPDLELRWSINNRPTLGSLQPDDWANGDIGSSFYTEDLGVIYLLGDADVDTDEFDEHVVMHEWAHYLEDSFFRTDSIGGEHAVGDSLDMRLAMGEASANAIAAILLNDPVYKDSFGPDQGQSFTFSIEQSFNNSKGWFSELSIAELIYDLYDDQSDGADTLALGLLPIWQVLTSANYLSQASLTSVHSFLSTLELTSLEQASFDAMTAEQRIYGNDMWANGEINDGGIDQALPVYTEIQAGHPPVEICVDNSKGYPNKLGNARFLRIDNSGAQRLRITANRTSGQSTDPDLTLWNRGSCKAWSVGPAVDFESLVSAEKGTLVIELVDWWKLHPDEPDAPPQTIPSCFQVSVEVDVLSALSPTCGVFGPSSKVESEKIIKPGGGIQIEMVGENKIMAGVRTAIELALVHNHVEGIARLELGSVQELMGTIAPAQIDLSKGRKIPITLDILAAAPGQYFVPLYIQLQGVDLPVEKAFSLPLQVVANDASHSAKSILLSKEEKPQAQSTRFHRLQIDEEVLVEP